MYHSHTYQEEAFSLFASFIKNVLEGNQNYQQLVNPILLDAHLLATGDKNYYTVDRKNYAIITYLVENDPEYFKNLNTANLNNDIYHPILDMVIKQRELLYA